MFNIIIRSKVLFFTTVLIIVIVILGNFTWIYLDTRPQPVIDPYVEKVLKLADGLQNSSIMEIPRHFFWASIGPRPPLYQILSSPLIIFYERSVDAILIINLLGLFFLGVTTYRIASLQGGSVAGLLASMMVITYPVVLHLMKIARAHSLIPIFSALIVLMMLELLRNRSIKNMWLLLLVFFLGFMTHAYIAYIFFFPFAVFLVYIIFFNKNDKYKHTNLKEFVYGSLFKDSFFLKGFFPSMTIFTSMIFLWIFIKWEQLLNTMRVSREIFGSMTDPWEFEKTFHYAISNFFAVLLVCSSIFLVIQGFKSYEKNKFSFWLVIIMFLMFVGPHFTSGARIWQNFSGVLPVMAAISGIGIVQFVIYLQSNCRSRKIKKLAIYSLFLGCFLNSGLNYFIVDWKIPKNDRLWNVLGASENCLAKTTFCPNPPKSGDWKVKEILQKIVDENTCKKKTCRVVIIPHRKDYYSDEVFNYSAVLHFPEFFMKKGHQFYPERTVFFDRFQRGRCGQFNWLCSDFLIFLFDPTGKQQNNKLENSLISFLRKELERSNGIFRIIYQGVHPNGEKVFLVSRVRKIYSEDFEIISLNLGVSIDSVKMALE